MIGNVINFALQIDTLMVQLYSVELYVLIAYTLKAIDVLITCMILCLALQ